MNDYEEVEKKIKHTEEKGKKWGELESKNKNDKEKEKRGKKRIKRTRSPKEEEEKEKTEEEKEWSTRVKKWRVQLKIENIWKFSPQLCSYIWTIPKILNTVWSANNYTFVENWE